MSVPPDGRVEFTIEALSRDAFVRPIAFHDLDGDGALDLDPTGHPLEPVGTGGTTRFITPEAGAGPD